MEKSKSNKIQKQNNRKNLLKTIGLILFPYLTIILAGLFYYVYLSFNDSYQFIFDTNRNIVLDSNALVVKYTNNLYYILKKSNGKYNVSTLPCESTRLEYSKNWKYDNFTILDKNEYLLIENKNTDSSSIIKIDSLGNITKRFNLSNGNLKITNIVPTTSKQFFVIKETKDTLQIDCINTLGELQHNFKPIIDKLLSSEDYYRFCISENYLYLSSTTKHTIQKYTKNGVLNDVIDLNKLNITSMGSLFVDKFDNLYITNSSIYLNDNKYFHDYPLIKIKSDKSLDIDFLNRMSTLSNSKYVPSIEDLVFNDKGIVIAGFFDSLDNYWIQNNITNIDYDGNIKNKELPLPIIIDSQSQIPIIIKIVGLANDNYYAECRAKSLLNSDILWLPIKKYIFNPPNFETFFYITLSKIRGHNNKSHL